MTDPATQKDHLDTSIWSALHREGLVRVSAVVDGNTNYDEILEYRLSEADRALYGPLTALHLKREQACAHIRLHLLEKNHKVLLPQFSGFVAEGSTPNNEREYKFFERICEPLGIKIRHHNYSNCSVVGMGKRSPDEEALLQAILESAESYYRGRDDISAGLVRQLTLFSVSFYRFVVAFHRKGAVRPGMLIQANDHSPVRVAMAMVMRGLGVPRMYLQHAEVTRSFPPLDFEYSVLRNARSKAVYEALGPLTGKVYVLPRHEDAFAAQRLSEPVKSPVTVAIYPTSRVLLEELKSIVAALELNPDVDKIIIKQHPAAARQLHDLLVGAGVQFADNIPDERHVALVGNSAVATELLHRGIPVYQCFGFDPVSADYYGFVASGLTHQVSKEQLSGWFWRDYVLNSSWTNAFKQLDPTVDAEYQTEQAEFVAEMQRFKSVFVPQRGKVRMRGSTQAHLKAVAKRGLISLVNAAPAISGPVLDVALSLSARLGSFLTLYSYLGANYLRNRTNIAVRSGRWSNGKTVGARPDPASAVLLIEKTLSTSIDNAGWLTENERLGVFRDELVIRALENLFQDRRPELNAIFESYDTWHEGSAVATWIYLKRAEWGNFTVDPSELDRLGAYINSLGADQFAKPLLERSFLAALIRCGTNDQLDAFWGRSTGTTLASIGTNTRIAVLQKLYAEPERVGQAVATRQSIEASSSPYEMLKLRNMDYLSGRSSPGWSHAWAEKQFEQLAPNGVAHEFKEVARPIYDRFRPKMTLMEVRTDPAQKKFAVEQIRSALEGAHPFSMIRLSDGEGYLFPGHPHFTQADASNRERHWWGTELPTELAARVIDEARHATAAADIVGLPSVYRFIRDTSDTSRALSQSLQGRGLLQVLSGLPDLLAGYAQISEDKFNLALFANLDDVLALAASARKTLLVGSVHPEHLPIELTALPNFSTIVIPTHARTAGNDRYVRNETALPFVYDTILRQLDAVGPGELVLVAGGIVGKIMLGHARERGAVAIDIGSVLDDWTTTGQPSLR